jgi:uncharacterized protein YjbI with pentapeptide repeats
VIVNRSFAATVLMLGILFSSCSSGSVTNSTTSTSGPRTVNGYEIKQGAYLADANLAGADLNSAYLYGADLSGADLSNADLSSADLWNANLEGANLTGANLSGADLTGARLLYANLTGANLTSTHLTDANFIGAIGLTFDDLIWAEIEGAVLPDGTITG